MRDDNQDRLVSLPATGKTRLMREPSYRWIALLVICAGCVYLSWRIIEPFMLVLLWAVVLAIVARRPFTALRTWGRGPSLSALLATLGTVLAVLVPVTIVAFGVVQQVASVLPQGQRFIRETLNPEAAWYKWASGYVDLGKWLDPSAISSRLEAIGKSAAASSVSLLGDVLSTAVQFILVLFTVFYLLRDSETLIGGLGGFLPLSKEQFDRFLVRCHDVIAASLRGVLFIAAIQGALGGIGFWALGISSPMFWGVVMFFLSMIPMAGAFIVWVPVAVYLAATGHYWKATLLTVWGGGVIGMADNLLRPRMVGSRTRLHELVVFFSVLGGINVFGVLGIIAGPVVIAMTTSFLDVLRRVDEDSAVAAPVKAGDVTS